jgi:thiol-disulfide isomerase/thioredoxin
VVKRFLLGILFLFAAVAVFKELRPPARFDKAADTLLVQRLGSDGAVIRDQFEPRLAPFLAVYHGAGWCPPCQQFSPRLAEFYREADKSKQRFQLLMVNYDQSDAEMLASMRQHRMDFPAVRRSEAGGWGKATGRGIPNLIIIDTSSGKAVTSSFKGSTYVGCDIPLAVLRTIIAQGHP